MTLCMQRGQMCRTYVGEGMEEGEFADSGNIMNLCLRMDYQEIETEGVANMWIFMFRGIIVYIYYSYKFWGDYSSLFVLISEFIRLVQKRKLRKVIKEWQKRLRDNCAP